MRVSELCGLCWRNAQANGDGGQITVFGKGDQTRSIQLPASVWKHLEKLRGDAGDDQPLFLSRKRGGPLKPLGVLRIVRQAAKRAGIELAVSPHWMRHAHASHALDRGAPIHLVQAHPRPRLHHYHRPLPPRSPQGQLRKISRIVTGMDGFGQLRAGPA